MTYRWVEHTADVELDLEAEREEDIYRAAAVALAELVADENGGEWARHPIALEATDRSDLLVAFLEELVYLAETKGFVPERVEKLELRAGALRGVVTGRRGAPRPLVKAVTYHGLRFEHEQDRWRARVVLDV